MLDPEKLTQEAITAAFKVKHRSSENELEPAVKTIVEMLNDNASFMRIVMQSIQHMDSTNPSDVMSSMMAMLSMGIVVGIDLAETQGEIQKLEALAGGSDAV
jgi:hypothetical protein